MRFKDKVVVITGAASGIGAAAAVLFAKEGARLAISDLADLEPTMAAIRQSGRGDVVAVQGDISQPAVVSRLIDQAAQAFAGIDILINNAGIPAVAPSIEQLSEELWDRIFAVNVKSGFLCTKAALPYLRRSSGSSIIFTSSIAGLEGTMGLAPYAASKAAVINLAKSLALDHAHEGIRVNVVCPGATNTAMLRAVPIPMEVFASGLPLRKVVEPDEIAEGFAYLASSSARSITGHVLVIDAGYTAGDFRIAAPQE